MLADKIENMSIKEIINELGIPSELEDIRATYRYDEDNIKILEFERKIKKTDGNFNTILELFGEYETIFDKYIYIFHIAKLLEKDLNQEEKSSFFGTNFKELVLRSPDNLIHKSSILASAKNMLTYVDIADLRVDRHSKKIVVELSQEYVGNSAIINKRNTRAKKKIEKIDNLYGMNNILKILYPSDLTDFFRYPNFANVLVIDLYNGVQNKKKEFEETDLNTNKKYYWSEFKKVVKDNMQYVDLDKMIILYLYIMYNNIISNEMSLEEIEKLNAFMLETNTLIENADTKVTSRRYPNVVIDFLTLKSNIYSLKNNCTNGKYTSDKELAVIFDNIINENDNLNNYSKEIVSRLIGLAPDNLRKLCLTDIENVKCLVDNGFIDESNLNTIIKDALALDTLAYLLSKEKLTNSYIENAYCSNIISSDNLRDIKNLLTEEDIDKLASEHKLILLRKGKKHEKYLKYLEFYKILKIENRKLDKRIFVGNRIVEEMNANLSKDDIMSLYYEELIPIELVVSLLKTSIIKIVLEGNLIPMEVRKLFYAGSITMDMFIDIIKNIEVSNFTKLSLIFSTFPFNNDSSIRNKLLEHYIQNCKATIDSNVSNVYASMNFNPAEIWKAISNIAPEYCQKIFNDGNILFYLPNKNQYIIKKIFKKNAFIYGSPTYIINDEIFEKNIDTIICEGAVNEGTIVDLVSSNQISKFVNTGWDNEVDNFFEIKVKKQYNNEQINIINNIMKKII